MSTFFASLLGGFIQFTGSWVGRILVSLGLGYASFIGIDSSLEWFKSESIGLLASAPPDFICVIGALRCGEALSIIISAWLTRMAIRGMTGGVLTKMVMK